MKNLLFLTIRHFFPHLNEWFEKVGEVRKKGKIRYSLHYLFNIGLFMYLLKLGSRRQINYKFKTAKFIKNLNIFTGSKNKNLAHSDTLGKVMKRVKVGGIERVRKGMINSLIRKRVLEKFRLMGKYYMIALDGTGVLAFKKRHCPYCLVKKVKGKVIWYHNIKEAKLICGNGMVLSIGSEIIDNRYYDKDRSKQDCELKAFYRLVKKLKKDFPQLSICLLLDSLYLSGPVKKLCSIYNWKCIITFKEGSMPEMYKEYMALRLLQKENRATLREKELIREYQWVEGVGNGDIEFNAIECKEEKRNGEVHRFLFATNFEINELNYEEIVKGGRLRWKIENEGFNMQKTGGYEMEHLF